MTLKISLTRRVRTRKLKDGPVQQTRHVLNWTDPRTGAREQRFFKTRDEARIAQAEIIASYERGTYSADRSTLTIADVIAAWLETKRGGSVRPNTLADYEYRCRYIVGPLLPKDARRKIMLAGRKTKPSAKPIELLGQIKAKELTTREIRAWHRLISDEVSVYAANKALMVLKAAIHLAAEDYEFRPPAMPSGLQKRTGKMKPVVLTPDQVRVLLAAAQHDPEKGVYYAAPFLMGTRPSEQLGLHWEDVDFERNVIRIRRSQRPNGVLSEMTKTEAGLREIPMAAMLRQMLVEWKLRCPRKDGELERVFPALGRRDALLRRRVGGGGALLYANFHTRIWAPTLKRLGLPLVKPHSARHAFISTLQAEGVEVGLVAKLAGHKNAVVTLSHYTHAMRGGDEAVQRLDKAFGASR
jgi:integrase